MKQATKRGRAADVPHAARQGLMSSAPRVNGVVPEDLRRHNRGLILELFSRHETLSRADIALETRLTGAAISRISRELLDAGFLVERASDEEPAGRGRPAVTLELAADGGFVIGVGIGAFEQAIQVANLRGECVTRRTLDLLRDRTPHRALANLARDIRTLLGDAKVPSERVFGIGVAIAGVVDHERGIVLHSPNIGWTDVNVAETLTQTLGVPARVEAMHHALNLAESRVGANREVALLVNAAMGIGASVMDQGRIIRGSHAAAGQIGHMRVSGAIELCTCGRRGCLDTVASGHAVLRWLGLLPSRRTPKEHDPIAAQRLLGTIERERRGEREAVAAFRGCGEQLGDALNAARSLLDPARIILAGPLSQTRSYVEGVRTQFGQTGLDPVHPHPPTIYLASHSSDGAAARVALAKFVFSSEVNVARLRSSR